MRYPADQKARTRQTILEAAARVFKRRGYHGGGVDAVMKEAGLTHGGFYAHFRNKESLLAETVLSSMLEARGHHADWTAGEEGRDWLQAFVQHYLSPGHRQHSERGCPVPTLVSELDRVGDGPRQSFEEGLRVWADDIAHHLGHLPEAERSAAALGFIAAAVGGLALSRAVADEAFAEQILQGARRLILEAPEDSKNTACAPRTEAPLAEARRTEENAS